jgi:PPOX class probable F420-dependent enzyme
MASDEALRDLLATHKRGVLVTLKRDGRPQLSNVAYAFDDGVIRISVTEDRAKTKNLRRDPRASFHVAREDFYAYAVAEGDAELTPVAADPHDATVDELVEVYRAVAGEHDDWEDFRAAMVRDRRLVVRLPLVRVYGMA